MRMKLFLALGLSFVTSLCSANPLTSRPVEPVYQDKTIVQEKQSMLETHRNPYHHHGYMRSNHHLLSATPKWSQNFLIGIQGGYSEIRKELLMDFTSARVLQTDIGLPPLPSPPFPAGGLIFSPGTPNGVVIDHEETITDNGMQFGGLLGWQFRWCRALFGLEGDLDFISYEQNRQFAFTAAVSPIRPDGLSYLYTSLYDRGPTYTLSFRTGYFVTPFFMPYVRLGVTSSRDEVSMQSYILRDRNSLPPVVPPFATALRLIPDQISSNKKTVTGWVAGIGAEIPTYIGASSLRIEYNYGRSDSIEIQDNGYPVYGTYTFRRPNTSAIKFSWVWNFIC